MKTLRASPDPWLDPFFSRAFRQSGFAFAPIRSLPLYGENSQPAAVCLKFGKPSFKYLVCLAVMPPCSLCCRNILLCF